MGALEALSRFFDEYHGKIVLASSFGAEDQVLTHMLMQVNPQVEIFTIDTGRLYPETLELLKITEKKYKFHYTVYRPNRESIASFGKEKGLDSIYDSIANRKSCCYIRKIEPLQRALKGVGGWITGLRRTQSANREQISKVEIDENHGGIYKLSPLANWSDQDVWAYIKKHDVPCNKLHAKGYPSIGCEPCTRAVKPGEDIRVGRWWWEKSVHKECGLHEG